MVYGVQESLEIKVRTHGFYGVQGLRLEGS